MLNKEVNKNIWDKRSTVKDLHYCLCLPQFPHTHTVTHTHPHSLTLTHTTFPKSLINTKHKASHLGAGLPAALVHPPSPNFSSHQARRVPQEYTYLFFVHFFIISPSNFVEFLTIRSYYWSGSLTHQFGRVYDTWRPLGQGFY